MPVPARRRANSCAKCTLASLLRAYRSVPVRPAGIPSGQREREMKKKKTRLQHNFLQYTVKCFISKTARFKVIKIRGTFV